MSTSRALAPLIDAYIQGMVEASQELKRIATEAKQSQDRSAEAALWAKIVDQATSILRVFRAESGALQAKPIRSQADLPRWDDLPPEVREKWQEANEYADRKLGLGWWPRMINGEKVYSDDPEDYKPIKRDFEGWEGS